MKKLMLAAAIASASSTASAELILSGAFDGPLPGGLPKGVELYVSSDIPDLSMYGVGFANNGGGTDGVEFTFPAVPAFSGDYIYLATESVQFEGFFGFAPDYTTGSAAINGDDAIELFLDGLAIDLFGELDVDGTGQAWEYLDGWAKRDINSVASGIFQISEWSFSGANALDNETSNASALTPFPLGETVTPTPTPAPTPTPTPSPTPAPSPTPVSEISISEIHYDNDGADIDEGVELTGPIGADLNGWSIVLYNGNGGAPYAEEVLSGSLPAVDQCDAAYLYVPISGIQNGSPDGIALVDDLGNVVEFLSYEGELTATDGPASGLSSTDIGVAETSTTEIGFSLQNIGGVWNEPAANTFGDCQADAQLVKIHEIQGAGESVAISSVSTVSAIVTASFQSDDELSGFFLQEEDADADSDPASSEGIFVFCSTCPVAVQVGDLVEVTGQPSEFNGMSQLTATQESDITVISSANALPSAAEIDLPIIGDRDMSFEPFEGMRVNFVDTLSVTEFFNLGRFGEMVLSEGGRLRQFTDMALPDEAGYAQHLEDVDSRTIILDDVHDGSNFALFNDIPVFYPQPGLSVDNFFRGGDTIENLSGVLQYSFSEWRVRPSSNIVFNSENPRIDAPSDVGGSLKVASFNVLNYFSTVNENGSGCGPDGSSECRGAHSAEELLRQTQKIVAAVCAIDADVVGLMELENPAPDATLTPIAQLVESINEECGSYAALETGTLGTDAITVGFIYKPETVDLVGTTAILDDPSFTDPNSTGSARNRPAIAQSFKELATGSTLTVAVNHLKSKGSSCGDGDDDELSGQGNCNLTRTLAAEAETLWLASNPTGVDSDLVLIIGDLNAYRNEDPITAIKNAGYTDLVDSFGGESAYGFVFDGQLGYLDHALANDALTPYVTGVSEWHINADETSLLDYNDTVLDTEEASFEAKPSATELFAPDAYRSSDHDPVVIGLALPESTTAETLVDMFYAGLKDGTIKGAGRHWFWQLINRYVFGSLLEGAAKAVEREKSQSACALLTKAEKKSDGGRSDLVTGTGVADLNAAINEVLEGLACTK